jgi:ATP-dependent Clp protease ATP-binding subunit ClpC
LTEAVRRRPYRVILLDEIEKAHPEVFNTLLQVMDDGRLTDGQGRTVDFKNTVIIMTSNTGVELIKREGPIGFATPKSATKAQRQSYQNMKEQVLAEVRKNFRPEFLNRLDDIIIFHPLDAEVLKKIVSMQVALVQKRLADRKIEIELTDAAREFLAEEGFDMIYGARPLKRVVQRDILNPLASKILSGEVTEGSRVRVDAEGRKLVFRPLVRDAAA